jgi:hypothetical protein
VTAKHTLRWRLFSPTFKGLARLKNVSLQSRAVRFIWLLTLLVSLASADAWPTPETIRSRQMGIVDVVKTMAERHPDTSESKHFQSGANGKLR